MEKTNTNHIVTTVSIVCIMIVGLILRCWNINQSYWWDELWGTVPYAYADSLWKVVDNLGWFFNNHIFYSLLSYISVKFFGHNEVAARLPALLMGIMAVYALFAFGKQFIGPKQGLVAAFLLAISSFHIDHSSEARSYSGLALFSILSSLYFLKALKTNNKNTWVLFIIFTALGFYNHPFMWAVSLSQSICIVILYITGKSQVTSLGFQLGILKRFIVSLFFAALVTVILYSPAAPTFFDNIRKVIIVDRDRMHFVVALLESNFPGIVSISGVIVYGVLLCAGMTIIFKKDIQVFIYCAVLLCIPLMLDLAVNPMFVFMRFFIFALPFSLLIVSSGLIAIAESIKIKKIYQNGFIILSLAMLLYLQVPFISTVLNQDRQNYREAIQNISNEISDVTSDFVFSIGFGGEHFQHYAQAKNITIARPQSLDELLMHMHDKKRVWCLISGWLPDARPHYEDPRLYTENPGQVEIYEHLKERFTLNKYFDSKLPVRIYFLER